MNNKSKLTIIAIITALALTFSLACDPGGGDGVDPCLDGHDFSAIVTTTATCTEAGEDAHKCIRCPYTVYTNAAALGHIAPGATPATCTATGNSGTGTCSRCGASVSGITTPALGHDHFESLVCNRTGCNHQYALGNQGPGGGRIFYVADSISGRNPFRLYMDATDTTGIIAHYLEAAPSDSGTAQQGANSQAAHDALVANGLTTWNSVAAMNAGLQGSIGRGRRDTRIIVAYLIANPEGTQRAAQVAAAAIFGGYNDWFLPSLGELNALYQYWNDNGRPANLNLTTNWYWSSSQFDSRNMWGQRFFNGSQLYLNETNPPLFVRAIRAF